MRYLYPHHTPLTYRSSNRPLRTVCPMICPVLLKYPDEFISKMKVVWNRSTNPDTPPTRVSHVHDTLGMIPPSDTLFGNHPEPVVRPRMNSRSEQYTLYHIRASLAFHLSCNKIVLLALLCIYCFFPPLLLSGSPDERCRCPGVRLLRRRPCTPTVELPGKQCPLPSSRYRLSFSTFLLH